jgi:hypothetical protein
MLTSLGEAFEGVNLDGIRRYAGHLVKVIKQLPFTLGEEGKLSIYLDLSAAILRTKVSGVQLAENKCAMLIGCSNYLQNANTQRLPHMCGVSVPNCRHLYWAVGHLAPIA